jgi:phage FluMu gp28-like protein
VPDGQGIGAHIAQALVKEFGERRVLVMIPGSKPENLPVQVPEEMVTETKRMMEDDEMLLMRDKEQIQQFRRTKRTPQGKISQGGTHKRSHYDRMWSTTYASYGIAVSRRKRSAFAGGLIVVEMGGKRGAA